MTSTLAAWLSRSLVRCYPRRWRQRYGAELLDVLDQHRAGARTVLNLAGSVLTTHLDPAYRTKRSSMIRVRRCAFGVTAVVAPVLLLLVAAPPR